MPAPEQTKPPTLSLEDQLNLDKAFHTLQDLRDSARVISGRLPDDTPVFPGKFVRVSPYYMNRSDPTELGVWKIVVEGTMEARLQSVPEFNSGLVYIMTVKGEDKVFHTATQEETHQLAMVVGIIHENCPKPVETAEVTGEQERHIFTDFGKFLIAKFK